MRDCYASALRAGGRPSGAPAYRCDECFNMAVCDFDGNTFEVIFREYEAPSAPAITSEQSRVLDWQENVARSAVADSRSSTSVASSVKSRTRTAMELASTTSKAMSSRSKAPSMARSQSSPPVPFIGSVENPSKTIVGTLLGAAAGAAVAYAMCQSEQDSVRKEADAARAFATNYASKVHKMLDGGHRNFSTTESHAPTARSYRRNWDMTESAYSSPQKVWQQRAIEPASYDDDEVQYALKQYTWSRRPTPTRRATTEQIECAPASRAGRSSRSVANITTAMPESSPQLYLEGPRSSVSSHRRASKAEEEARLERHDSAVSSYSHRSSKSHRSRHSARPRESSSTRSKAVSPSRRSSASTVKPLRKPPSRSYSAADVPLPPSQAPSYISAAQIPIPESSLGEALDDAKTVVPDDSISCVASRSYRRASESRHGSSHHSRRSKVIRASEAGSDATVKPAKSRHSALSLPVRTKSESQTRRQEGKRSMFSVV